MQLSKYEMVVEVLFLNTTVCFARKNWLFRELQISESGNKKMRAELFFVSHWKHCARCVVCNKVMMVQHSEKRKIIALNNPYRSIFREIPKTHLSDLYDSPMCHMNIEK